MFVTPCIYFEFLPGVRHSVKELSKLRLVLDFGIFTVPSYFKILVRFQSGIS